MEPYDLIIIGAGASGLLLADALVADPHFRGQRILLLEKSRKIANDRTWCFWEAGEGPFDPLIHHSWSQLHYRGKGLDRTTTIHPLRYKMLRGIDFYRDYLGRLEKAPNLEFRQAEVLDLMGQEDGVQLATTAGTFKGRRVFNSVFDLEEAWSQTHYPVLLQHFLGWRVRSTTPCFAPDRATMMDFAIPQQGRTCFMYVLPFNAQEALVEYTLFSADYLDREEYEQALRNYLEERYPGCEFEILETEWGSIPMTAYPFSRKNSERIHYIGVAGGWAKPSTGYTFMNSFRQVAQIVAQLRKGEAPLSPKKDRFWYYDLWMLDFLYEHNERGHELFSQLFRKRDPRLVLKFLDEKTSWWDELRIISACPKRSMARMALRRILSGSGPSIAPRTSVGLPAPQDGSP